MKKYLVVFVLGLASCAAMQKVFTPSASPDGTGKSPAQQAADDAAPFLPAPWGEIAKLVAAAGTAIGVSYFGTKKQVAPIHSAVAQHAALIDGVTPDSADFAAVPGKTAPKTA